MKIYNSQNNEFEYNELITKLDSIESPFKEIINKEDYSSFSFSFSEEKIPLSECCVLLVNIKDSASVYFVFNNKDFDKKKTIKSIEALKNMGVSDLDEVRAKTSKLFEVVKEFNPYFIVYRAKDGIPLSLDNLKELNIELPTFYVDAPIKVEEPTKDEEPVKEESKKEKYNFKAALKKDSELLKKNKYHFLFLTVASFLFGFAISVGYCNNMVAKMIAILFYVCSFIGVFLNVFIYMDNYKNGHYKDRMLIMSVLFNVLGVALSIGASVIFYNLDKNGIKDVLTLKKLILFNGGLGVAMIIGSMALALLIRKLVSLKKKR